MSNDFNDMPWVIFYLLDELFAISAKHVREMVAMPKVVQVPRTHSYVRGVINLRGQTLTMIDLRLRMGMKSMLEETKELIQLMHDREKDHKNWIQELEASVTEKKEFHLTTDPNKCAFGSWFNNFRTDNRVLANLLKKFKKPHNEIHKIGTRVKALVEMDEFEKALQLVNQTKDAELSEMIKLFAEVRTLLTESSREIALVLEWEQDTVVISVDSVKTVEKLDNAEIEQVSDVVSTQKNEVISGIGKRGKNKDLVQLLDIEKLVLHKEGL